MKTFKIKSWFKSVISNKILIIASFVQCCVGVAYAETISNIDGFKYDITYVGDAAQVKVDGKIAVSEKLGIDSVYYRITNGIGYFLAKKGDCFGVFGAYGKIIVDARYSAVQLYPFEDNERDVFSGIFVATDQDGLCDIYSLTGKLLVKKSPQKVSSVYGKYDRKINFDDGNSVNFKSKYRDPNFYADRKIFRIFEYYCDEIGKRYYVHPVTTKTSRYTKDNFVPQLFYKISDRGVMDEHFNWIMGPEDGYLFSGDTESVQYITFTSQKTNYNQMFIPGFNVLIDNSVFKHTDFYKIIDRDYDPEKSPVLYLSCTNENGTFILDMDGNEMCNFKSYDGVRVTKVSHIESLNDKKYFELGFEDGTKAFANEDGSLIIPRANYSGFWIHRTYGINHWIKAEDSNNNKGIFNMDGVKILDVIYKDIDYDVYAKLFKLTLQNGEVKNVDIDLNTPITCEIRQSGNKYKLVSSIGNELSDLAFDFLSENSDGTYIGRIGQYETIIQKDGTQNTPILEQIFNEAMSYEISNPQKCIDTYQYLLYAAEGSRQYSVMGMAAYNIGVVFYNNNDYDNAEVFFNKALSYSNNPNASVGLKNIAAIRRQERTGTISNNLNTFTNVLGNGVNSYNAYNTKVQENANYNSGNHNINLPKDCKFCINGKCSKCHGNGTILGRISQSYEVCPLCNGRKVCQHCNGKGVK